MNTWISPNSTVLHVVEVAGRLEHQEDRLIVELQLGHLVGLEGVFDRQRMELEGGADLGELGLGRLEQADPDEPSGSHSSASALADLQRPGRRTPSS